MVQILLEGLRADARFEVHHVDARMSDDLEDVGSFRPQKFIRLFKCILQAWWIRLRHGSMAFYYVPAPAKRSAIMRDWVVMALCRPLFPELILHWHAYGLGEWVVEGKDWQRKLTRWALGKADLSIVLNNYNKRDAAVFEPKRIEVVPNGIVDQFPDYETALAPKREARAATLKALQEPAAKVGRWEGGKVEEGEKACEGGNRAESGRLDRRDSRVAGSTAGEINLANCEPANVGSLERVRFLFLGHLIESKGVFVAIEATGLANEELRRAGAAWRAHLTLAGSFASEDEKARVLVAVEKANRISHGLRKIGEDRSTRLAEARTGGDALSWVTPAQGGFVPEELGDGRSEIGGAGGMGEAAANEGPCVTLVGFLGAEQKKSALEKADGLVFPTFYENEAQPLVLFEAMCAGLPVVTTSWRGIEETLPRGYPLIVEPRSATSLAAVLADLGELANAECLRMKYECEYKMQLFVPRIADSFLRQAS